MAERRPRRSPQQIAAELEADHVAVMVIGWSERRPTGWGDNIGAWPVKVVATKDPKAYLAGQDLGPVEVGVLALVWTLGRGWADRLRAGLERAIAGQGTHLRRSWYDLDPVIAELALAAVAEAEGIEVFGHEERMRRLAAAVARSVAEMREGWG